MQVKEVAAKEIVEETTKAAQTKRDAGEQVFPTCYNMKKLEVGNHSHINQPLSKKWST